ncbi:hypothetical protein SNEBB_004261 [Seison nebaliae]|nr:hypothetical protein SNEBB_004261 [Seison nebaliae]
MTDENLDKKWIHSPCVNEAFMIGIPSGIIVGSLGYLFTSRGRQASNIGFGVFFLSSIGFFQMCQIRYRTEKRKLDMINEKAAAKVVEVKNED